MRVLLAALTAPKGDLAGNLGRHVELLERAQSRRCDLAVFPEFSLTGSVDPLRHPQHALAVDAEPVRQLAAATHRTGVGAVFGIAERAGDGGFFITQLYACGGRLLGAYRKRHLGEDEAAAYRTGTADGVFRFGAARFGIAICAEGEVDLPWRSAATAGAAVVFFCAAPGLTGRRTDPDGWRAGHAWWEQQGLGDAIRHARRHRLWVAVATQAGSTQDEDFPGLAALVSPDGEVTHRLPDWRPGELVVDLPVEVVVQPVRQAARALVVDDAGRTLLVRFADPEAGTNWWCPPGGGLADGEDHLTAVRRELREELGRDRFSFGPWIGRRTHTFRIGQRWMTQQERWVLCRTGPFEPDPGRLPALRAEGVDQLRWWTADQIRAAGVVTVPRSLTGWLDRIAAGQLPAPDTDLGC